MPLIRRGSWAEVRRKGFGHFVFYRGVVTGWLVAAWVLLLSWIERRYNIFGAQLFFIDMWRPLLVLYLVVCPVANVGLTICEWFVREWAYSRRVRRVDGA